MNFLNEQAQLFMVASACTAIGIGFLYIALTLYGMLIDKSLKWFGVHAAIMEYIVKNRKSWWARTGSWYERNVINR